MWGNVCLSVYNFAYWKNETENSYGWSDYFFILKWKSECSFCCKTEMMLANSQFLTGVFGDSRDDFDFLGALGINII